MIAGNTKFAQGLETYLLSRDHSNLRSEFQLRNGKVSFLLYHSIFQTTIAIRFSTSHRTSSFLLSPDNCWLHWKSACCRCVTWRTFIFDCWGLLFKNKKWVNWFLYDWYYKSFPLRKGGILVRDFLRLLKSPEDTDSRILPQNKVAGEV